MFASIGVFGALAATVFFIAGTDWRNNVQGVFILLTFAVTCGFLYVLLGGQGRLDLEGLDLPAPEPSDEPIHLPGPSWWPAAYGVAAFVLMLGLVFNYTLLWAGIVLLVLTTVGWALESVHDYRREIAHAGHDAHDVPDPAAIEAALRVQRFKRAHGGADAVLQHLGNRGAEIVLIGSDGAWGNVAVRDLELGRTAGALAAVVVHDTWPAGLGNRVAPDRKLWARMSGILAWQSPDRHEPRDGNLQVGAVMFLAIGIFGLIAAGMFYLAGQNWRDQIQGVSILLTFMLACGYLFVAMRIARGAHGDERYADESGVTREATEPDPPVDLATLHMPGPSWWPAAYGGAAFLLMLGLVFSYVLLWIGIALIVASTIGWAIESVHEYRATLAHTDHSKAHPDPAAH